MTSRILRGELIHRTGKPVDTTEAERAGTRAKQRGVSGNGRTFVDVGEPIALGENQLAVFNDGDGRACDVFALQQKLP